FRHDYVPQKGYVQNNRGAWIGIWTQYGSGQLGRRSKYLGSIKRVPYEKARTALDAIVANAGCGRPYCDVPLTPTQFGIILRRVALRAGLPRTTFHMLRHSFAIHLYQNGADLLVLQVLLGHADISATVHYARPSAFSLVEVFERCHPF